MYIALAILGLFNNPASQAKTTIALFNYADEECEKINPRRRRIRRVRLYECDILWGIYNFRLLVEEKCAQGQDPILLVYDDDSCRSPIAVYHPTDQNKAQCYDFTRAALSAKTICGKTLIEVAELELIIK